MSAVNVHERPLAKPIDKLCPVGRSEHVAEAVVGAPALHAFVLRDEMQVVIPEHRDGLRAERAHEAKHAERFGAAIHEIAHEPETIAGGKSDVAQQLLQFLEAALHVADRVSRHGP
jgi:hypothetical protein